MRKEEIERRYVVREGGGDQGAGRQAENGGLEKGGKADRKRWRKRGGRGMGHGQGQGVKARATGW